MAIWNMNIGDCRGVEGVAARVRSLSVCVVRACVWCVHGILTCGLETCKRTQSALYLNLLRSSFTLLSNSAPGERVARVT